MTEGLCEIVFRLPEPALSTAIATVLHPSLSRVSALVTTPSAAEDVLEALSNDISVMITVLKAYLSMKLSLPAPVASLATTVHQSIPILTSAVSIYKSAESVVDTAMVALKLSVQCLEADITPSLSAVLQAAAQVFVNDL